MTDGNGRREIHMSQVESPSARSQPGTCRKTGRRGPVFALGLSKTATTSLHKALIGLGYKSCHWRSNEFSEETLQLIESGAPLPFDAYTNVASVVQHYEELDLRFPSAAFILTVRDLDEWLASRTRHVTFNRALNAKGIKPPHTWIDIDPVGWRTERILHHEAVFSYFKDRPDKLLVLDIPGGDGWPSLSRFLGCDEPSTPFPWVDPLTIWVPQKKTG
jgi:Sulfotransferase domain